MKLFIAVAFLLVSFQATALPQVGIRVKTRVTNLAGIVDHFEGREVTALEASKQSYSVNLTQVYPTYTQLYQTKMWGIEVSAFSRLTDCVANGGELVSVTVPAGTFDACKTTEFSHGLRIEVWQGLVPFVDIKKVLTSSATDVTTYELVEVVP